MAENYDLIFGQSASSQYAWSDSDYQNGWQTVGSTPPTAEQFDALQRRNDMKAKDLNDRLSPIEEKAEVDGRQAATSYTSGAMLTVDGLPNGWLLECIVPGISGTDAITLPDTLIDGLTIIDGDVTWVLRKVSTNGGLGYRQPSTAYAVGNIAYHASLPTGWYLECTTAGTTGGGELTISSPSIGGTVSDGTVKWQVRKGVTLPYELPSYMETLLDDGDAATARATLGAPSTTGANASGNWNINAATATKLATPRTIALSGDATGSASFDGSGNATIATTLAREVGLTDLIPDNAGAHNAVYRGKALGAAVTAAQWAAIKAGTFRDLFIGDYWTINGVNWRIAAFDYWLHCGNSECTTHHVVIVPDTILAGCKMNSANTTTGGYVGSDFYTGANDNTGKATAVTAINSAFGSAHILSHREYLSTATTNGKPTGASWFDSTVELMNEAMVYGTTFLEPNPNGANQWDACKSETIDKAQLPLFAHDQSRICNRYNWWLRGIVSPTTFANVHIYGDCTRDNAGSPNGVRPAFGIKQS